MCVSVSLNEVSPCSFLSMGRVRQYINWQWVWCLTVLRIIMNLGVASTKACFNLYGNLANNSIYCWDFFSLRNIKRKLEFLLDFFKIHNVFEYFFFLLLHFFFRKQCDINEKGITCLINCSRDTLKNHVKINIITIIVSCWDLPSKTTWKMKIQKIF